MAISPTTPVNQSFFAQPVRIDNFVPKQSAHLPVSAGSSASVTFSVLGVIRNTFKITNKGTVGAYIGWGNSNGGAITAVVSTITPQPNCDYVGAGAILTQDFQADSGTTTIVDTLAAIGDGGDTVLEISYGYGQ